MTRWMYKVTNSSGLRNVSLIMVLISIPLIPLVNMGLAFFVYQKNLPSEVYTWDCEIPDQKPEAITITCGDGGQYIDGINWDSWGASGAHGTGTYHVNDCEPNCAEGNFLSAPVTVELSNLTTYKGKGYLRTLDFKTLDGANLPDSGQSIYQWDVMEFAEAMAE
jgi:hypothetical protein